ncbi:MAG: GFA family protein [Paracoccaceae bacterium]
MTNDTKTEIRGSCNCGAVHYHVTGSLRPVIACHCTQCRKASGHYVSATGARREDVAITGQVQWYQSSAMARRGFCPTCGSNLFWDGPGTHVSIHAGTLDGPSGLTTKGHIYCADKGDYYDLPAGAAQTDADDPDLTTMVR